MYFSIIATQIVILIAISAACSGLNIALLSLDVSTLKRQVKLGNKAAKRVLPLRKNSHLSLASILLTNVGVISATSLVLEHHFNGLIAGLISTLLIVIFGEVVPQAFFAKHSLTLTNYFSPFLRLMIIVTYPISRPLQLILDKLVGHETFQLQSRHELGLMITEHSKNRNSDLDDDEVEIMRGALLLSEKRVRDIMTSIKNVYWLTPDTVLTGERIDEIKQQARSRIPVLNHERSECFGVLLMKDLVDIDFDNQSFRVEQLPLHKVKVVGSMTALDTMFRKFINSKSHLMPVEKDDIIIGIVTIEDLIEEIIGQEIEDETDRRRK